MHFISPLRYPGGKRKLLNFLSQVIVQNQPAETYIEPFAGGAGAALGLLVGGFVERIVINDYDEFIYKFWKAVLEDTENLLKKMFDTKISIDEWKKQKRYMQDDKFRNKASDLEIGFAGFYLNRCNRSGILREEIGPIGGIDQQSKWAIGARFNKATLAKRIEKVASLKGAITLHNFDAIELMKKLHNSKDFDNERSLIYLDPPYFDKGPSLYRTFFLKQGHIDLHNFLKSELSMRWILSYDDVEFIKKLYSDSDVNGVRMNHFANKAKVGKELIILSDNCIYDDGLFSREKGN